MKVGVILASALFALVGACAQTSGAANPTPDAWTQNQINLPDGGPPVGADGLHNNMGSCPGEGCSISEWQRVSRTTELREQPSRKARVIATLAEGDWVRAQESVNRVRPIRGVVDDEAQAQYNSNGGETLHLGDVVYSIDYEGEGFISLWRRGDYVSWYDSGEEGAGIRWEPTTPEQRAADTENGAGFWLQVQRENGQVGWASAGAMECLGAQDPTNACRTRNVY